MLYIMKRVLKIESKIENINKVEKIIDEISEELDLHSDLYGNLLIATIEGVSLNQLIQNAISHEVNQKKDKLKNVV